VFEDSLFILVGKKEFYIMRIQLVSIIGSVLFLLFIFELTRKEKIREAYSLLWLFMGVVFLILSVWRDGLDSFSNFIGIGYSPTALMLVMIMGIVLILIQYSIVVSQQTDKIKQLSQELALLSSKVASLEDDNSTPTN